jgi:hypothetical protein
MKSAIAAIAKNAFKPYIKATEAQKAAIIQSLKNWDWNNFSSTVATVAKTYLATE